MTDVHEGGCACGAVRYRTRGTPRRISACCCRWCQTRTGSVIALSVYFEADAVEFLRGELHRYRLTSDAGRWIETGFCPTCGTTIGWTLEFQPGAQGLAGGTFDDPSVWYPERLVFDRGKPDWLTLSGDIPCFEAMPPS